MARRSMATLRLRPARAAGKTCLTLRCPVPDSLPPPALHALLSWLVFWSGERLDVALDAAAPAGWLEVWVDALAAAPERHLHLRFVLPAAGEDARGE